MGRSGHAGAKPAGALAAVVVGRLLILLAVAANLLLIPATSAHAAATASPAALAGRALNWAEGHALGHPYVYGGAGPGGYDCSGLVMAAYAAVGVSLPHSTYAMLASPHLHRIPLSKTRRGDLLFFTSGHVEFATIWSQTSFGAQQTGTFVGWHRWSGWWRPTMAFRVS